MTLKNLLVPLWLLFSFTVAATELSFEAKKQAFVEQMSGQSGYSQADLKRLFQQVHLDQDILAKISRPKEKTMPWFEYRRIFSDTARITNGAAFFKRYEPTLNQAYQQYGVPPSIIVAIIGVETRYGKVMGKDSVLQALTTIAFAYPRREAFFSKELTAFLQMCQADHLDPLSLRGSYAGAMGMAQFMPSSYLRYAVDYDGDGKRDLWHTPEDAIFSIANYLAGHGWQAGRLIADEAEVPANYTGAYQHQPFTTLTALNDKGIDTKHVLVTGNSRVGLLKLEGEDKPLYFITFPNFAVITTYNTSPMYAMAVFELAKSIESQL